MPQLNTAAGATLGVALAELRSLYPAGYPAGEFSVEQGGSIHVSGTKQNERLFIGFFSSAPSTPLTEIKGGHTCGDV